MSDKQGLIKKTVTNSLVNLSSFSVTVIVSLLIIPFIVHRLGLEQFGIYGLFIALLGPLGITNIGVNQASIKYISEYQVRDDYDKINQYFNTSIVMVLAIAVIGSSLILLFGFDIITYFFQINQSDYELVGNCLFYVAAMWFIGQVNNLLAAIPIAFQKFAYLGIGNVLLTLFNALFIVLFINMGLEGLLLAYCLGNAVLFFVWIIFIKRLSPKIKFNLKVNREAFRKCFSFGGWQTLGQVGGVLSSQSEKYLIGAMFTNWSLGVYVIAHDIHAKLYMPIYKLFEVLFPLFSSISDAKNKAISKVILIKSSWFANLLAAAIMIPFIPLIVPFLKLWISPEVSDVGSPILTALIIAAAISACSLPLILYFTGHAKTRFIAMTALAGGVISLTISYILLKKFDIRYAGYGAMAAFFIRHLIYVIRIKMAKEGFVVKELFNVTLLPICASLVLNATILYFFEFEISNWLSLGLYYLCMMLISILFVAIIVLVFDDHKSRIKDIKLILQNFKRKRSEIS